jgi:hypothetical protein
MKEPVCPSLVPCLPQVIVCISDPSSLSAHTHTPSYACGAVGLCPCSPFPHLVIQLHAHLHCQISQQGKGKQEGRDIK